jgi:predicted transglutaminase-like cysteine proteinase
MGLLFFGMVIETEAKTFYKYEPVVQKKKIEEVKPTVEYKDFEFTYDKVDYKSINAPVFSTTKKVIFQPLNKPKKDGRYANMMNAISNHEKEQPPGWGELVLAVMEETDDLKKLKMANAIINKVPYKDGTDGTYYHPAKLYKKGGVCKDMTVAKYLLLKDAGYDVSKLRVAVLTPKINKPESPFHVVLVANANKKDYILDLMPAYLAEQERSKNKTTSDKQLKEIREAGLDIDDLSDKELINPKGFYSLEKYVSERGLIWTGNEVGIREQFVEDLTPPKKVKVAKNKK